MTPTPLSPAERLDWLRLIRSENVGVKTFYTLLKLYGSAGKALEQASDLSLRGGRKKPIKICSQKEAEKEIDAHEKLGAQLIARYEPLYPKRLSAIDDPPPMISVLGDAKYLNQDTVAMVGARNASHHGCQFAKSLARDLAAGGYVVASGLARGIDTFAHQGALEKGVTIAVLAGGVDHIYPPENKGLYQEIAKKGCIVAESPLGAVPRAEHFPRRNRIISGISLGTIVVEATLRSGSLITSRLALEQGREVFAVPGFPLDPRAEGPNKLIKQGATLIENANDVIENLSSMHEISAMEEREPDLFRSASIFLDDSETERLRHEVISQLNHLPVSIDRLVEEHGWPLPKLLIVLLELELAGRLQRHAGNKVSLIA